MAGTKIGTIEKAIERALAATAGRGSGPSGGIKDPGSEDR
jgi:hypothetical protein